MNLSDRGATLIADFEGIRLHAYNDPVGYCTVGIGHLLRHSGCTQGDYVRWGTSARPRMSRAEAYALLRKDVSRFEDTVEQVIKVHLSQAQFDALVSLAFNIGQGAFSSSTVARRLNQRDYKGAAKAFLMWVKAGGQTLPGLVRRRNVEAQLFLSGTAPQVRLTDKERHLIRLLKKDGIAARRRIRARDWLRHQARLIQTKAQAQDNWKRYDRGRRFQAIRKALGIKND